MTLNLQNNQLSGSIPTELSSLTSLVTLNLQNNQLSGSIPTELSSLTNLVTLSLADNELTGSIPTELGSLTSLVTLWLWYNNLTGSVSVDLSNLNNLRLDYPENGTRAITTVSANSLVEASTYWTLSGDDADEFSISGSGELTFSSPPDYESPADAGGDNRYTVVVDASDGTDTDTLNVELHVTNVDEAGTVTLSSTQPRVDAALTATLTDPDGTVSGESWQ